MSRRTQCPNVVCRQYDPDSKHYTFTCTHKAKQEDILLALFTWTIETRFETQLSYVKESNFIRSQIQNLKFGR